YGLAGLASRLLWGMAIARFGIRRPFLSYGVFFGLGILLFILPASNSGILASALFLGGAASGWQLFQAQVLPDYFGRLIVGSLTGYAGILLTITRSFAPLFAAVLYDSTHSYVFAFSVFAIACFVGSAGVLLTPSPRVGSKQTMAY
ncbi:MAG: hypothetical protein Q7O66_08600, partial [Dehalococcoidia bacterium]|nr:hypothetical protein [Dehalococcoidia bacterium]